MAVWVLQDVICTSALTGWILTIIRYKLLGVSHLTICLMLGKVGHSSAFLVVKTRLFLLTHSKGIFMLDLHVVVIWRH